MIETSDRPALLSVESDVGCEADSQPWTQRSTFGVRELELAIEELRALLPEAAGSEVSRGDFRFPNGGRRETPEIGTVVATPAAIVAIMRLRGTRHVVALRQSGDRLQGDAASYVSEAQLPPRINEIQLGQVGGVPFLIDADRYRRWGSPDLLVDIRRSRAGQPVSSGAEGLRLTLRPSR